MGHHLFHVIFVATDKIDDSLAVIFGDVFRFADLALPLLLRVVTLGFVGRLVLMMRFQPQLVFVDLMFALREGLAW